MIGTQRPFWRRRPPSYPPCLLLFNNESFLPIHTHTHRGPFRPRSCCLQKGMKEGVQAPKKILGAAFSPRRPNPDMEPKKDEMKSQQQAASPKVRILNVPTVYSHSE